jgi:hypothetical protein
VSVHFFLVTAPTQTRMQVWTATASFANWLEVRGDTASVTCFDRDEAAFLDVARQAGVTVEEIEGGGDSERYVLRAGEPGTGWVIRP